MRTVLQLTALAVAFVSSVFWLFGGAHPGRTETRLQIQAMDPATGRIHPVYVRRLIPGLDFLAAGWAGAGLLLGGSFLAPKSDERKSTPDAG